MKIVNAIDMMQGKTTNRPKLFGVTQPLQFIHKEKKTHEWACNNLDYLEWQGLKQIKENAHRFLKNYKLSEGIIDKSDYIPEPDNDMTDLVNILEKEKENRLEATELKFYPIIPNVINTFVGEFAKRDKKVSFEAIDEYTYNEIMEHKRRDIEDVLTRHAQQKMLQNLIAQGLDPEDPEVQEQIQKTMNDEIQSLPEIQEFYGKSYQVVCEKWATRQYHIDEERFMMDELEKTAFKDKLITDREFWHFKMMEDDYKIEVWDPCRVFYQKSPDVKYISDGAYVGYTTLMNIADVIDDYGWKMTEKQLKSLEKEYITQLPGYAVAGTAPDDFYDASRSYKWNTEGPSLGMRQFMSVAETSAFNTNDVLDKLIEGGEGNHPNPEARKLLRVTTAYWKSQMRVGLLTKISDDGTVLNDIVTEDYVVTDKPIYDNSILTTKTTRNLLFGEHIEWMWINQIWGGIKIGPNVSTLFGFKDEGLEPIYIGINSPDIRPLLFQFKGDNNLYGCKLPVEGAIFNERNVSSMSIVDILKPYQIAYNIVNNQIQDILCSEIGTVVMLDQNTLPRHSLDEDWGKGNYAKAVVAMRDFSILPLDTSITNTENALNFQHFQQLDLSQTQRLMSRINLANYFKQQAYELIGVSAQRMGTPIAQKTSATEAEQIQVSSFAQTEEIFTEHTDELMPRVHQMRNDLAQYYAVKKPSIKMRASTTEDERLNFEINRTDLMMRDIHVYCTAKSNVRKTLEQLKQFAIQNNTTGASIYDIGQILQADSLGTLNQILKNNERKQQEMQQQQMQQQQMLEQQRQEAELKEKQMEYDFKAQENEADRRNKVLIAEIKASGYGAMQDINQNQQSDFLDSLNEIRKSDLYANEVDIKRGAAEHRQMIDNEKLNIKREELQLKRETNQTNMAIAKENKNRFDFPNPKPPKKENKE